MSPRLAGIKVPVQSPSEAQALLEAGDITGLLELHRARYGSATMVASEDDEDDADDEDEESEDADESEDDEDEGDEDEDEGGEGKGKSKKPDPKDVKIQELTAESKKYRLKNREHRTRISQLEAEVAELKRSSKKSKKDDEDDDEDDDRGDAPGKSRVAELERTNEDLLIRLEFMANGKYSWKNPKAALKLLDLSDVEINEDGEVEGLDEAIEQLAKDEPYLLTGQEDQSKGKRRPPTGQPTGGKRKGNPNRDKLISKYPALRR